MRQEQILSFLKEKVILFKTFDDKKLIKLIEGSHFTTFEPKEAVIEFGEEGRFLGVLFDGEAEASITDDTGQRFRVGVFKKGDFFGEISLMTGDNTIADVIGITRCLALLIPQTLFSTVLVTEPSAIRTLSQSLTKRIQKWAVHEESGEHFSTQKMRRGDDPYGFKLKTEKPQKILVINCGSSSLKYTLFDTAQNSTTIYGSIEKIDTDSMLLFQKSDVCIIEKNLGTGSYREAFAALIHQLLHCTDAPLLSPSEITLIGHRVVHGGDLFSNATIIDSKVISKIESLSSLAPLHNPINLIGIREAFKHFPLATHVAVFDTAFHQTIPNYAFLYGLPYELYKKKKIRRYGFHGMSHFYVALKAAQFLNRSFNELEIISCHLGNGASVCAIDHGRSVDTSMGFTPTDGLIMGTRSGAVDPGILLYLMDKENYTHKDINNLLNKESGLLGLSGISNDMREVEAKAEDGNHRALLAYKTFCYNIRKYIGAYVAAMQGLDAIIFTGGIGQGSPGVRSLACQRLNIMGIEIDQQKNRDADGFNNVTDISKEGSPIRILVVPTNEELMIARESLRTINRSEIASIIDSKKQVPVPLEVSAHHVHLSQENVDILFGKGHSLTPVSDLSQPNQYACKEMVTLSGPKGTIKRVRVLGPVRNKTQVEIAMTEQFKLGIYPPIRESGDINNTPGITITGSVGEVTIKEGVICALRHIHMSPEDALTFGVRDKYRVRVRIEGNRELTFGDVLVRVHPTFKLAMHLDTDEANAAGISNSSIGHIEGIQSRTYR